MVMKMERCTEEIPVSLLSMVLLWLSTLLCSAKEITMLTLDSRAVCDDHNPSTIHWASKDKTIFVIGRGAKDRQFYMDCSVVIGAATVDSSILQLNFEAFNIRDCGVTLAINQSHRSDFVSGSTTMAKIGCKHGSIKMLHSQEKHYVRIAVHKESIRLQQYNFRINITVIDLMRQDSETGKHLANSVSALLKARARHELDTNYVEVSVNRSYDKLPETGPQTHVVIIVGIVVLLVVGTALWLLVKYLIHRTQRWQEHCAERNMERAIRLYNSQETPPESDYMYTALPPQDVETRQLTAPSHRNGHCHSSKTAAGRGGRHRAGDISFVHADGHIETFRMRSSPQERRSADSGRVPSFTAPRSVGLAPLGRDRDSDHAPVSPTLILTPLDRDRETESAAGDHPSGDDILGDCPPSYEEALHMPTPHDPRSPLYVNLDTKNDDNHDT